MQIQVLGTTITIEFSGNLARSDCEQALAQVSDRLRSSGDKFDLIFDCSKMTSYDTDAREHFVEWHRQSRSRLRCIAIVTKNPLWHVVISAMALATGHDMKIFPERAAAEAWVLAARH